MSDLVDLVEALGVLINEIPEWRVSDVVPQNTNLPAAFVVPPIIDYDNLNDSGGEISLQVVFLVDSVVGRSLKKLYPAMYGPTSLQAKLQKNRDLGLGDVDVWATDARPLGLQEFASYQAYGAVVNLQAVLSP